MFSGCLCSAADIELLEGSDVIQPFDFSEMPYNKEMETLLNKSELNRKETEEFYAKTNKERALLDEKINTTFE